jgi:hypothetical protein
MHVTLVGAVEESLTRQRFKHSEALTAIDIPKAGGLRESHRKTWHLAVLRSDEGDEIVRSRRLTGNADDSRIVHA